MTWEHYRLGFRLISPLHIGYRKVGNLMQTRPYATAKALWGALTARLTRLSGYGSRAEAYLAIGEAVRTCFRFGYLYPALSERKDGKAESPNELEPRFPWEESEVPFDYLFLGSYASTALDYEARSALEGSLHETEFISPRTRPFAGCELGRQVYLVGDLWVAAEPLQSEEAKQRLETVGSSLRDEALKAIGLWKEALKSLQLGGERGYGWGRVEPLKIEETGEETVHRSWRWDLNFKDDVVLMAEENEAPLIAHALAAGKHALPEGDVQGSIEPLLGRETRMDRKPGFGTWLSEVKICWEPGGKVREGLRIRIGRDGIWEKF